VDSQSYLPKLSLLARAELVARRSDEFCVECDVEPQRSQRLPKRITVGAVFTDAGRQRMRFASSAWSALLTTLTATYVPLAAGVCVCCAFRSRRLPRRRQQRVSTPWDFSLAKFWVLRDRLRNWALGYIVVLSSNRVRFSHALERLKFCM